MIGSSTVPGVALVTGASRGIGLEFVRQYAADGWRVVATARDPEHATTLQALAREHVGIVVERLDVTDHASIDALAARLRGTPIDVLVNNAAIGGGGANQIFGHTNYGIFDELMHTNVSGPLKVCEAFIDHVAASARKKLAIVTSWQGSIGGVNRPGPYFYSASKSALNMIMRQLALVVRERGVIVCLVAPGATDTDFMQEVRGKMPLGPPAERTRGMIEQIERFTLETSGRFVEWDGRELPW